jgi:hypothetical protein
MARIDGWQEALRLHGDAAAEYARAAASLPPAAWAAPIAEGKWTPAQITDHLVRAYEVVLQELGGGQGMALRTRGWQRVLLRFTVVPLLLAGKAFPKGARAPRETRPIDAPDEQAVLIGRFRSNADRFQAEAEAAYARNPHQRLTHAYFGAETLPRSVLLCARHIQHHRRQLPTPAAVPPAA